MSLNPLSTYKGLAPSVYFLFIARTINSLGDFVYPLITMYLTLKLGMNENQTGFFVTLAAIAAGPGVLLGGYLGDRIGRKNIIIGGQLFASILVFVSIFYINTLTVAYLLILSMFFMSVTRPIYNAMLIDLTQNDGERKSAFSLLYLGINIGIAIGPLVAGVFFEDYLKGVFIGISLCTFISTLLIILFVKESRISNNTSEVISNSVESKNSFVVLFKRPILFSFILLSILNFFIYIQYSFSMPLQMNSLFDQKGPALYGSLMTVNAISVIVLTPILNSLTKKMLPILIIAIGALFYALGFGMFYVANIYFLISICTIIWTIGEIMVQTNLNVYIAKHSPASHRGRFNGFLLFIGSLGYSLGPYIMGKYINKFGVNLAWPLIFLIGIVYALSMYVLYYVEKKSTHKKSLTNLKEHA
ncbi:MFS transporter [Priestia megaterium]|uniref:MFS transporter n=1 Tax=Priestia megaterium TaxID=1404 RepID=UPI001868C2E6|nr:MFS transporter [Priestia megaterium]MBE2978712.1 MFS transporter [Priestia megaterium]MBV6738646.1 MFS transporter [Priestia megaterium]